MSCLLLLAVPLIAGFLPPSFWPIFLQSKELNAHLKKRVICVFPPARPLAPCSAAASFSPNTPPDVSRKPLLFQRGPLERMGVCRSSRGKCAAEAGKASSRQGNKHTVPCCTVVPCGIPFVLIHARAGFLYQRASIACDGGGRTGVGSWCGSYFRKLQFQVPVSELACGRPRQ